MNVDGHSLNPVSPPPPPVLSPAIIGRDIRNQRQRMAWRQLVMTAHEASRPGGPLEGWLFHGTLAQRADGIARLGVVPYPVMLREPVQESQGDGDTNVISRQVWSEGTCWATAWVASFYADDAFDSALHRLGQPGADAPPPMALVAVPLDTLKACGALAVDEQSMDTPVFSRLGYDEAEMARRWFEAIDAGRQPWEASLAATGSLVCLGAVPETACTILRHPADLDVLLARVRSASPAMPAAAEEIEPEHEAPTP